MSDSSIGWATLSVIPGMAGFGAALSKGVEPQLAAAGLAGGSAFAKAFAPVAIVAAVAAVGVATTKMAAGYQEATTLLVTGAGESVNSIGMIRDGLLAMAPAVGMGPEALAKAMFLVESAGFHGAAGLTVMNAAAQGAKVGGVDATLVADGLTTAMIDYHYAADEANNVTSKLVQTVALGKTNMGDLSSSLSNILPFAANLKIGFNDIMGAMATMTGQGIDAAKASTMLKFGIMALANETPKGADALAAIGLTTQQVVTDLGEKGLSGTIAEVTDAIGKKFPAGSAEAVAALSDIFGGTRGIGMALALSGQNADTFTANIASIAAAVPEADGAVKGWTLTQEDLNTQLSQVGAFLSSVAIKLGTTLIPWVTKGTEAFRVFAGQFDSGTGAGGKFHDILTAINDNAIKPIGNFLTGTAIPAIRSFVQGFKDGTGIGGGFKDFLVLLYNDAIKPIADYIVSTVVPAVQNFIQQFRDGEGAGGKFRDILKAVWDKGLVPLFGFIKDTALPALKTMETWLLAHIVPAFEALATGVSWLWTNVLSPVFQAIGTVIGWLWNNIISPVLNNFIIPGFKLWGSVISWLWTNVASPTFAFIGAAFLWLWDNVLSPTINFIVGALQALGAGFSWLWTNAIQPAIGFIEAAWQWMWDKVIAPVITSILKGFASITGGFADTLGALGNIPGGMFDWAKDAADKMLDAAGKATELANNINSIPNSKSITVSTSFYSQAIQTPSWARPTIPAMAEGGIVSRATVAMIGEGREPEVVTPLSKLDAMLKNAGGGGGITRDDLLAFAHEIAAAFTSGASDIADGRINTAARTVKQLQRQGVMAA